jgi:DMSO reductase family type II enzyme chaperone
LQLDVSDEAFQVEFISLFEVGMGGAPCPLHSGYYSRDRMRDLEEVVRFYRFFDYEPNRTPDRFPDHLVFELEFMAHLVARESAETDAVDSLRLAQRDFVTRHLAGWTPQLHKNIEERASIPFIKEAVRLTDLLIGEERDHLGAVRQAIQNA